MHVENVLTSFLPALKTHSFHNKASPSQLSPDTPNHNRVHINISRCCRCAMLRTMHSMSKGTAPVLY